MTEIRRKPAPECNGRAVLADVAALRTAPISCLKQRWRDLYGCEAPPFSRPYLQSRLAFRIQELAYGRLRSETVERLEALGERLDGGKPQIRRVRQDGRPVPGTQLLRTHRGVEHVVTVLTDGFEYDGRLYRSLSAIARSITGTRWNGWTFFGLKSQRSGV